MILFNVLAFLVLPMSVFAGPSVRQEALIRDEHFHPVIRSVELVDLVSDSAFDGRYFKIVEARGEIAIPFTGVPEALRLKAATVYHHLTLARRFWVDGLHSEAVRTQPKVTVRLEISDGFSDLSHFGGAGMEPEFNNAVSIPAGNPMPGLLLEPWGNEIWFRPSKAIRLGDLPGSGLTEQGDLLGRYVDQLLGPIREGVLTGFVNATLQKLFYPSSLTVPYPALILGGLGTLAVATAVAKGSRHLGVFFKGKRYFLDTAMVPEIIAHEFGHLALSDHLELSHSTPVNEGFADYFAAALSGHPDLAAGIKRYSRSAPKRGRNHRAYSPELERLYYSNADFVLSVLWAVREAFPESGDRLILRASYGVSTRVSDIRHDLVRSLIDACTVECRSPRTDRLRLVRLFESRGF